ncbi:hypothetical protein RBI13_06305 [Alcaligenaceae bacterium A4P071]|nr:hypothetical protein [Alcaligenaceae bacterium A4P071]
MSSSDPVTLALSSSGAVAPAIPDSFHPMLPAHLAMLQPSRLSVSRSMMAKALKERWRIVLHDWRIDANAVGTAVYHIDTGAMVFSFSVLSFAPTAQGKTGRIIGRSWDMMGALTEGRVSDADLNAMAVELPKLYEGRATPGTLIWARANRSSRAFDHTVQALVAGEQPDIGVLSEVCYLMRNTGLDGNGTFGTRSFLSLEADHPLRRPLDAQMLSAYMMRTFSIDLAHHLARVRNPEAPDIDPAIQRYLGVGNGSALGLILFVNNHPRLIHNWLTARQQAIQAACALRVDAESQEVVMLDRMIARTIAFRREDRMEYERFADSAMVASELAQVRETLDRLRGQTTAGSSDLFGQLARWAQAHVHEETCQCLLGLLTELVPDVCDREAEKLAVSEDFLVEPDMPAADLRELVRREYAWAFEMDVDSEAARRHIWYKSVSAEEPRRGPAAEVEYAFNLGLDLPRLARDLHAALLDAAPHDTVGDVLMRSPQLRNIVARVQTLRGLDAHSPHMNIMDEQFVPVDIVRLMNVGMHGVDKARDYLGRNLRGVLFHGAPTPADMAAGVATDWFFPQEPR